MQIDSDSESPPALVDRDPDQWAKFHWLPKLRDDKAKKTKSKRNKTARNEDAKVYKKVWQEPDKSSPELEETADHGSTLTRTFRKQLDMKELYALPLN